MFLCILCSNVNDENTVHYMYTMQLVFCGFWSFLSQHNCIQDFHFDTCVYAIVTIKNVIYLNYFIFNLHSFNRFIKVTIERVDDC